MVHLELLLPLLVRGRRELLHPAVPRPLLAAEGPAGGHLGRLLPVVPERLVVVANAPVAVHVARVVVYRQRGVLARVPGRRRRGRRGRVGHRGGSVAVLGAPDRGPVVPPQSGRGVGVAVGVLTHPAVDLGAGRVGAESETRPGQRGARVAHLVRRLAIYVGEAFGWSGPAVGQEPHTSRMVTAGARRPKL